MISVIWRELGFKLNDREQREVVVLGISIAVRQTEGSSPACGKANWFLDGSFVCLIMINDP